MRIDATGMDFQTLNRKLRQADTEYQISGCCGQRFIAAGMDRKRITIDGIPGNALGAYLNGATIAVHGNAQDAVGDTMNAGAILIYGNTGDAAGYAMRGGKIYVKGNAGYRAGIHMKEYQEKVPVMIIGGTAGSFLGEYQAGGRILVLNLLESGRNIAGNFPCGGRPRALRSRAMSACGRQPRTIWNRLKKTWQNIAGCSITTARRFCTRRLRW